MFSNMKWSPPGLTKFCRAVSAAGAQDLVRTNQTASEQHEGQVERTFEFLLLRPVEERSRFRQHGDDREDLCVREAKALGRVAKWPWRSTVWTYLLGAVVLFAREDRF